MCDLTAQMRAADNASLVMFHSNTTGCRLRVYPGIGVVHHHVHDPSIMDHTASMFTRDEPHGGTADEAWWNDWRRLPSNVSQGQPLVAMHEGSRQPCSASGCVSWVTVGPAAGKTVESMFNDASSELEDGSYGSTSEIYHRRVQVVQP